jgi:hypothetical protein
LTKELKMFPGQLNRSSVVGGAVGTVSSVSTSGFIVSTAAGQKVTVDEASSTAYKKGPASYTEGSGTIVGEAAAALPPRS